MMGWGLGSIGSAVSGPWQQAIKKASPLGGWLERLKERPIDQVLVCMP